MEPDLERAARARATSEHYEAVKLMSAKAGNPTPDKPTLPSVELRKTCANLILEEALEAIDSLGFYVCHSPRDVIVDISAFKDGDIQVLPEVDSLVEEDLANIAHECADLRVVASFAMAVSGISDESVQMAVDQANLAKFGPGGYKHPESGKWIKPPDHKKPDIAQIIHWQKEG